MSSNRTAVAKMLAEVDLPVFVAPPEGLNPEQAKDLVDCLNLTLGRMRQHLIVQTLEIRHYREQIRKLGSEPEAPLILLTEDTSPAGTPDPPTLY